MSEVSVDVREDAHAFARLIARGLSPHMDDADALALTEQLERTLADLYGDVTARRIAVVDAVIDASGTTSPDEIDVVAHVARTVLGARPRHRGAGPKLERLLTLLRGLDAPPAGSGPIDAQGPVRFDR